MPKYEGLDPAIHDTLQSNYPRANRRHTRDMRGIPSSQSRDFDDYYADSTKVHSLLVTDPNPEIPSETITLEQWKALQK